MERRQVLAALGAVATVGLAGCGGGSTETPPTGARVPGGPSTEGSGGSGTADDVGPVTAYPSLEATDFRVYNASGQVLVEVVVENPAERTRTMVLNVSTRSNGDLTKTERELSMEPGTSQSVNMTLPVDYDEWGGSLNFEFRATE
jgi:hypothetical protein